jgi:hypothetical protein
VQLYRYFVSQCSEVCRHNFFCCFPTSVYCCKRIFRYRLSPKTFGYTLSWRAWGHPLYVLRQYRLIKRLIHSPQIAKWTHNVVWSPSGWHDSFFYTSAHIPWPALDFIKPLVCPLGIKISFLAHISLVPRLRMPVNLPPRCDTRAALPFILTSDSFVQTYIRSWRLELGTNACWIKHTKAQRFPLSKHVSASTDGEPNTVMQGI